MLAELRNPAPGRDPMHPLVAVRERTEQRDQAALFLPGEELFLKYKAFW